MRSVYGIAEIACSLGVRRQTVAQWHARGKLPPPTQELAAGPVWLAEEIESWIGTRRKERADTVSTEARLLMLEAVRDALDRRLTEGMLVFGPDGSGGAWYSDGVYGFSAGAIIVRLRPDLDAEDLVAVALGDE